MLGKPKYLGESHADTGRTCKVHTERPSPPRNWTLDLFCCETTVLTTRPPSLLTSHCRTALHTKWCKFPSSILTLGYTDINIHIPSTLCHISKNRIWVASYVLNKTVKCVWTGVWIVQVGVPENSEDIQKWHWRESDSCTLAYVKDKHTHKSAIQSSGSNICPDNCKKLIVFTFFPLFQCLKD